MWKVILGVGALALINHSSAVLTEREGSDGPYPPARVGISEQYGLPQLVDSAPKGYLRTGEALAPIVQNKYELPLSGSDRGVQTYQRQSFYPVAYLKTSQVQPQLLSAPASPSTQYGVPQSQRAVYPSTSTVAYQSALQRPSYQPQRPSYPTQGPSYPSQGPSYPSQGPSYPSQGPSYPSQGPSYPSQGPSYPSQGPSYPLAPAQIEGGELSPEELERPSTPQPQRPSLTPRPGGSSGDVLPGELEIPRNTQIKLQDKDLQYSHGFSDDKGTTFKEQGSLLSTNDGWEYVIAKKGSYSYVSPEGTPVKVNYIADHNGFRVLP